MCFSVMVCVSFYYHPRSFYKKSFSQIVSSIFFFYRQPHLTGQLIADAMQQSVYISLYTGSLILKK